MNKFKELLTEAGLSRKKVDSKIKSFRNDNNSNGPDKITDLYQAAEIFLDDEYEVMEWLENNNFDAVDYVASRL